MAIQGLHYYCCFLSFVNTCEVGKGSGSFVVPSQEEVEAVGGPSETGKKSFKNLPTYQKGFHDEESCNIMKYSTFGKTGLEVSVLGFGGAELGLVYGTPEEENGIQTVIKAVKSGINYIDTAPYYIQGKAEIVLGKALKQIPRNTYYLATKVARYGATPEDMFDFSYERTLKSFEESLDRLGVDYIDILQIKFRYLMKNTVNIMIMKKEYSDCIFCLQVHDVEYARDTKIIVNETLPALQKLKDMGKIKFIGITGYPISKLKEVLEKSTVNIDAEKNLGIVNAAILGMGLLTENGPPDWHPVGSEIKEICKKAADYCKEHNANISKIAVCHSFSQHDINVHLVGMQYEKLLEANLLCVKEGLSQHENNVKEEILSKYFKNLTTTHWENKEVQIYWKNLEKLQLW
ncbi:l-galactose dehydrogenase [Caerostris extrusa]|uniref:L-galactose dehydrogenase n=1 Tax=Caerostris extrusa TaxID=172846 RepID=A0AAV4VUV6_CAEEX|nr:l-galactose dehydrogenase [Caerostris extrusa]